MSYCYEATNTANVTLHDPVDSEPATIISGLPYDLPTGRTGSAGTGGVTIDATTTSTATRTAYSDGEAAAHPVTLTG